MSTIVIAEPELSVVALIKLSYVRLANLWRIASKSLPNMLTDLILSVRRRHLQRDHASVMAATLGAFNMIKPLG